MATDTRENEIFTFLKFRIDVSACEEGIEAGSVKIKAARWDSDFITDYAEQILGLARDMPDSGFSGRIVHVNVSYARSLGPTLDARPLLLVETAPGKGILHVGKKSYFLANGNQRMAKAYFEAAASINVNVVSRQVAKPFLS